MFSREISTRDYILRNSQKKPAIFFPRHKSGDSNFNQNLSSGHRVDIRYDTGLGALAAKWSPSSDRAFKYMRINSSKVGFSFMFKSRINCFISSRLPHQSRMMMPFRSTFLWLPWDRDSSARKKSFYDNLTCKFSPYYNWKNKTSLTEWVQYSMGIARTRKMKIFFLKSISVKKTTKKVSGLHF